MLRITIAEGPTEQRWILQGRLVAPWVAGPEKSWEKARNGDRARKRVVDLSEVTRIDERGEKILADMTEAGVELVACGVYTSYLIEQICTRSRR